MLDWLWLIPALPLLGFVTLVAAPRPRPRAVAIIGTGSVGLAAIVAVMVSWNFLASPPPGHGYTQTIAAWLNVGGFAPRFALYLDPLSLVMMLVVTVVGFFIHWYSTEFMRGDEGYRRFFAYMNLFVGSMLILVLADNLLLLYLGWEGVGLCSYLLIGFWYKDSANGHAAMKAFIVTRVGDAAMAVGLFLLFVNLGSLDIQALMSAAGRNWPVGSPLAVAAAALLLGGAVGKSAQLPLQAWLPDAMAGPSPVSALIHAATMVTAGVYLIARTHVLFDLAPTVQFLVAIIGAATLLLAGCSALVQHDLKRVLAYSTISQIGYMFLALGVGAYSAAIFHFMTHAFFKALLFLAAGVVILAMDEEHDMFKMGGLRKRMPLVFWTFLAGSLSLSSLPLVTAGFYSKDLILEQVILSSKGGFVLWTAGLVGALLTSWYTFRMVLVTFFGPMQKSPIRQAGVAMGGPLVVLAIGAVVAGFVQVPSVMGNRPLFTDYLNHALPPAPVPQIFAQIDYKLQVDGLAVAALVFGILLAVAQYWKERRFVSSRPQTGLEGAIGRFWFAGWGFDWLYDRLFVRPLVWFARVNRDDFIDGFYRFIAWINVLLYSLLARTQTGRVRWYAAAMAAGAVAIAAIVVFS